ncbi:hypothetical protein PV08_10504 [Exophiala spinifera]|uniref:Protein HRI1 n=1 Tax=Exophiala spinifera TaxID=91928 RepID=A0A0D2BIL1_9EURO|nr:uncharacterized protein PV08_10504 [Exophiala spinifera]KIW11204.1 hypothetical protein PV08_10504 [Exophiala spinifera]
MSSRLSTRVSIRWVPGEPSEPTDTLVMSVGGWYVDLRITKSDGTIDWAMAGERLILSQEPLTCQWTHWIDSRGYTEPDVGSFKPGSEDTDSVETGSMVNPETNQLTPYEEVWRTLSASSTEIFAYAWILRSTDGRTFLGRVGGDFLGLKGGEEGPVGMEGFCARREKWDQGRDSWTTQYEAGDLTRIDGLPKVAESGGKFGWEQSCKIGDTVDAFGGKYLVCAIEKL